MPLSYKDQEPTKEELIIWHSCKTINPRTKRKIKPGKKIYNILEKAYEEIIGDNQVEPIHVDNYLEFRKTMIDPLLRIQLPLNDHSPNDLFKFKYMWNPYSGERLGPDPNGPLYFDPDTLVYFFYLNRLNYLWCQTEDGADGYYGDAVGNGPDFLVKSRGYHPDWYLFRLPIPDGYLHPEHCNQSVTMGPVLTDNEIREIDKLAKRYKNNYYNLHMKHRPSLIKMKKYYDQAINPLPIIPVDDEVVNFIEPEQLAQIRFNANKLAINKLKLM